MLRTVMLAWVAAVAVVQLLPVLPRGAGGWGLAASAALAGACVLAPRLHDRRARAALAVAAVMLALAAGGGYSAWRAQHRLADALAPEHENLVTRVVFQVVGLATGDDAGQQFEARVLQAPVAGVPSRLLVRWYAARQTPWPRLRATERHTMALVAPGQIYRAALVLRRPHGSWNPHGFDFEAWMFERGLRAGATVRGSPVLLEDRPWSGFSVAVQRMRHGLRAAMRPALAGTRYGPVVLALAMGDQAGVDQADWRTFNRVGITHLVSISGLHVTMLAGLAAMAALWCWKRMAWRGAGLAERLPAQIVAAACALMVAWLYCLVAGWGVPAQRTFFMLATVAVAAMLRLSATPSGVLTAALALVTWLDPWAPLSPGFWLSFGAVAVLMLAGSGRWRAPGRAAGWRQGLWQALGQASALQLAITAALVPALALQFNEVSVGSPLANALAIPVVSFVVTPLALAAMLCAPVPGLGGLGGWLAWAAERVLALMMWPIEWLAAAPWSSLAVAAPPWPVVALGCAGVAWALLPAGPPGRRAAWLLLAPVLLYGPPRPAPGEWRMTVLDVGQGAAAVIETARHTVVFDTGPPYGAAADAGERVVWPYLRARGVRRLDELVVSHADADHAGGLAALLAALPVARVRTSYPLTPAIARRIGHHAPCRQGQGWMVDGVTFAFLHPAPDPAAESGRLRRETNAHSCVLRVQGLYHAALLTGDIHREQERVLQSRLGDGLQADVVLMAHHGSRTSSDPVFVAATGAAHAVAQAGYLSRYGHPSPEVVARWRAAGTRVHRTDSDGAVAFTSTSDGLAAVSERAARPRYWHAR